MHEWERGKSLARSRSGRRLRTKSGEISEDILDDGLEVSGGETAVEINFAIMKIKHTIKRGK